MDLNKSVPHWIVILGNCVALFLVYIIWRVLKTWVNGRNEPRVPRIPVVCTEDIPDPDQHIPITEQNGENDIDIRRSRRL